MAVLTTPRLVLRPHTLDDFAALHALWSDPEVVRYIGGRPSTEEESWARLLRHAGHWAHLGFGVWAVFERDGGAYVGDVGFLDVRRAIDPPLDAPEMGWVLSTAFHGRGYARESCEAALDWLTAERGPVRTVCLIDPANAASLRLAARLGFREYATGTYRGDPTVLLERVPAPGRGAASD